MGQPGANLQHIGQLTLNDALMTASEATGVTAFAGGGQTNATLLQDGCNNISTVGTALDSVKLPPAIGGTLVLVANNGGKPVQIFGSGIDTIDGIATATGMTLGATKNALFFCTKTANAANATAGTWVVVVNESIYGYTVATLPTGTIGQRAYVTDATTPTYNGALTGGGAVKVPVFYNGTAWVSA